MGYEALPGHAYSPGPVANRKLKIVGLGLAGLVGLAGLALSQAACISAYFSYGIMVDECPVGTPKPGVQINAGGLRRGSYGSVTVAAPIFYTTGPADEVQSSLTRRFTPVLSLIQGEKETALKPKKDWAIKRGRAQGMIELPKDLKDGEYRLRAVVQTPLGEARHEVPLGVYAPARIHTLTDRPLYEPGNTILFRALVLRARDLAPLERRPGYFKVTDPTGMVVMQQKAPTGDFGVASGDFPLDDAAPTGTWTVTYKSGDAEHSATVRVEPFTLPRFVVEAAPAAPFYGVGDRPVVRGQVKYSSGAPVSGARLEISWSTSGAWPPPTAWTKGGLPKLAYAEDDGRFELRLPRVPGDLIGQARLQARITATDPAGDRVAGAVQVLLSKDRLAASAVTELQGGLVEGFNNRVYLRVTTADGRPMPNTEITVSRAWDPSDEGHAAKTDADGVAALQIDPGPAVNVLVPAVPVRPPPRPDPVRRGLARDLMSQDGVALVDQVRLDQQQSRLAPCARFVPDGSAQVQVGMRIDTAGRVSTVTQGADPLARCAAKIAKAFQFAAGEVRIFEVTWTLTEDLPALDLGFQGTPVIPDSVQIALQSAALDARRCLPENVPQTYLRRALLWQVDPGQQNLNVSFAVRRGNEGSRLQAPANKCVEAVMAKARLAEVHAKHSQRAFGVVQIRVQPGPRYEVDEAQDTTRLGYELLVRAKAGREDLGRVKLFLAPGRVPEIRLRATPVLAAAGQTVKIKVLRGPTFSGELPEHLYWQHEGRSTKMVLDKETRTAEFVVPKDSKGWFEVKWSQGRALVFVRAQSELSVKVEPDREVYPPGATAKLTISTTAGGKGASAGVGLIGVDQTLGQLAPLMGPDALSKLAVHPSMRSPAFGMLDAQALTLGRIQGAAAAAAVVVRVNAIPSPQALDNYVSASGATNFDPVAGLTDTFYRALGALYAQVRLWEGAAPKKEIMRPATMAKLWQAALTEAEKEGAPVQDAYGRRLRLSVLPDDLLALADPRSIVVDGTRLPEDVENWIEWVRKEAR